MATLSYPLHSCLWELTLLCNLHCRHCGSAAGRARPDELSLDESLALVPQIAALGCAELTFIGGEIFLYRGWEQIARQAARLGVTVNVMSNAYRIDEAEIGRIVYAGLKNVGVSIDGLEANHNSIRGRADSFSHIIRAFHLLNAARIPIAAVTSLMAQNYSDLPALYELLLSHNVQIWQIQLVNPMGYMTGKTGLMLGRDRIPELLEFIREKSAERLMTVLAADSVGYYHNDTESVIRGRRHPLCYWCGCQAGLTTAFIDSAGNVKGCGALYDDRFIEGNLRRRPLADIWLDPSLFAYNRAFTLDRLTGACRHCEAADVCRGGCRASNYFNLGTLYENAYCPRSQPAASSLTTD